MDRVTVAYLDEPPFCVPVSGAGPGGADMQLARRALTDAGVVTIDYTLTTFPELIPGSVRGGGGDSASSRRGDPAPFRRPHGHRQTGI